VGHGSVLVICFFCVLGDIFLIASVCRAHHAVGADQFAHLSHEAVQLLLLPAQLTSAVLGIAQHIGGVSDDRVDDLLGLLTCSVECLAGAHLRVGLDRLRLRAHQTFVVIGLGRDALGVLERRRDLLVGIVRDALSMGHCLVVQQQELLLGIVLAAGQGLFELEDTSVHLAHFTLSI